MPTSSHRVAGGWARRCGGVDGGPSCARRGLMGTGREDGRTAEPPQRAVVFARAMLPSRSHEPRTVQPPFVPSTMQDALDMMTLHAKRTRRALPSTFVRP